ncbi:alpha-galactosidase [Terrimonas sp. NA20]|uniref:Alpha-galactosidase n=1 Tax=Terrimonas ginsenosidimutans TaxID=2908004 RepID=A0ABS9KSY9_9BACT|nr:alpha-galactosidase [Terrimonas ginsenosidimutans]MCG2615416.1 alpha-galactosidase [Terrimonas ginsenosidimutans]
MVKTKKVKRILLDLHRWALLVVCAGMNVYTFAQDQVIPMETASNALVLKIDQKKDVSIIYYGKKLANRNEYDLIPQAYKQLGDGDYTQVLNAAYSSSGSRGLMEPAVSVTHADGNNSLDLRYTSHDQQQISPGVTQYRVLLKDPVYNFEVSLYYKVFAAQDVIEQWSVIKHNEKGNVVLNKFASANLYLKADGFWLNQYHGDWAKEMQPEESKLTHGIKTLDTKLGTRANLFQPSVFMVSLGKPASEDEGTVLYGALEYSGNFRTDLELDFQNNLRIISGINNYASPYTLKPAEEFVTPAFLYVLSHQGKGYASRQLHDWARSYKLLDGQGDRLTLLNNWEATYFDFNESKLKELLKDTKKLGVDLFLLDDGWFANKYPRNGDTAGLGDWQENKTKLPNGISTLVKEAGNNGVKFGIWVEPEMVNPKSELYEKHPDWVVKQPARAEHYFRNQLVLDLANPQVQDFVFGVIDNLFTKNPDLAYIKWDCNAVIFNAHSAYLKNQSHFFIEYMRGLYTVLKKIRAKYPTVPMMLCSGGGGRVDYAALQYFTEYWPSDNTDPLERIFIQWEYSYFYPAVAGANHVTDWGKQPIKYRTDVAMMGKLGFDIVVSHLNEKDLLYCQNAIKDYQSFKQIVWKGDLYRLASPRESAVASLSYVSKDRSSAVMFNYLVNSRYGQGSSYPVKLKGLEAASTYRLSEISLYPGVNSLIDSQKVYSGQFLMEIGFNPLVNSGRTSVVLKVEKVK